MKKIIKIVFNLVLPFLVFCVTIVLLAGYHFHKSSEAKTDPELYESVVASRQEKSHKYAFLPKSIPPYAEKVAFFHQPGFLQGGDSIILRIKVPNSKVKLIIDELVHSGREEISDFDNIPVHMPLVDYNIENASEEEYYDLFDELTPDYRVFLYESDLADIEKHWNHNFFAFTAVSESKNEIVYFVDNW